MSCIIFRWGSPLADLIMLFCGVVGLLGIIFILCGDRIFKCIWSETASTNLIAFYAYGFLSTKFYFGIRYSGESYTEGVT